MEYFTVAHQGLSPLTRGNQCGVAYLPPTPGPIPAHAGEPTVSGQVVGSVRAYPRSRGGTQEPSRRGLCQAGLSPLTRGNLERTDFGMDDDGPIPAHAGEPRSRR